MDDGMEVVVYQVWVAEGCVQPVRSAGMTCCVSTTRLLEIARVTAGLDTSSNKMEPVVRIFKLFLFFLIDCYHV
jgi:hypothetical protein